MIDPVPGLDRYLDPPREREHHHECPRHPWNDVFDEPEPCECEELRAMDEEEAAELLREVRRWNKK